MEPTTKKARRRMNILRQHWFALYGNPARPGRYTRQAHRALHIR